MNTPFALAAETNFFPDVWNYLYQVYLNVDGNYEHLGFDKSSLFSIRLLVLGLFLGIVFACIAMAYNKRVLGSAVHKLLEMGANSPENAVTYSQLGYGKKNFLIRHAFATSVTLRRVVKCVEEEEFYREQNKDMEEYEEKRKNGEKLPRFKQEKYLIYMDTDRFYIPEDAKFMAETKFKKKGSGILVTALSILALCVVFFVVLLVLPMVFEAANSLAGEIGASDPNIQ